MLNMFTCQYYNIGEYYLQLSVVEAVFVIALL